MHSKTRATSALYHSKIDLWLLILISLSVIGAVAWLISLEGTYTVKGISFGIALLTINIALPIWLVVRCHYTIGAHALTIGFGPLTWSIPFNCISQVANTTELSLSPSLSLQRLKIVYGADKEILISPKHQAEFLKQLSIKIAEHKPVPTEQLRDV